MFWSRVCCTSLIPIQIGGSLTGLFHGIVLKRLGHNVHILERAKPESLREQGAGIMAREDVQNFFSKHDLFDEPYFIRGDPKIQFLDRDATVTKTWNLQLCMTSWDTLYYRLRANFDGLQSDYVSSGQPDPESGKGIASYEYDCNVANVECSSDEGNLAVEYNRTTGVSASTSARVWNANED